MATVGYTVEVEGPAALNLFSLACREAWSISLDRCPALW